MQIKKQKSALIIISIIMIISMCACTAVKSTENTTVNSAYNTEPQSQNTAAADTTATITTSDTQSSTAKQTTKTEKKNNKKTTAKTAKQTTKTEKKSNKKTTVKTSKSKAKTTVSNKSKTDTPIAASTAAATTATAVSEANCTVTIECKAILNNTDKLKHGHEQYIPQNGYILKKASVKINSGGSVYNAIKSAADANNIKLNVESSPFGKYIAGINEIDEKDCGRQSGWVYTVNGKSPSVACSKYAVSNGDNIIFSFIVN